MAEFSLPVAAPTTVAHPSPGATHHHDPDRVEPQPAGDQPLRILDLFCGAGGAAMGYHRAFPDAVIVGIDIHPQPRYPFTFIQADALTFPVDGFHLIHASPPCQHFTRYRNHRKDITDRYHNHIDATRTKLRAAGVPFVIENVEGAPLHSSIVLCGSMFGLEVRRHRLFELSHLVLQPPCRHEVWTERKWKGSTGRDKRFTIEIGAWNERLDDQKRAMGVDWPITLRELSESIPPAYTEWIGRQLAAVLAR